MPDLQLIKYVLFAILLAYTAADATGQGKFADLTREAVAPIKQAAVNLVLHRIYPCLYALLALTIALLTGAWLWLPIAGAIRLALFDPVFTLSRGDKLWSLGTSAATDRLLSKAPALNPIIRTAALAAAVAGLLLL